jgi:membrane protein YqaA with SNARE-associated domain
LLSKITHALLGALKKLSDALLVYGPFGIFIGALIDSLGIPIPAAIDSWMFIIAVKEPHKAYFAALMAVLGSTGGNVALFLASHHGSRRLLRGEPSDRALKFRKWFHQYGLLTVFIPAVSPIPMPLKFFVITAGAMYTSLPKFLAVVLLARGIRYFGEAYLGLLLGEHAVAFLQHNAWNLLGIAVGLALASYLLIRVRKRSGDPAL